MELHPLCILLPEMPADQFSQLTDDIKANGLRHPITTLDGMILDGRHRYRACLSAGVEPRYVEYRGTDPAGFILSENVNRRHLTTSQRAMVAAKLADYEAGEAMKRMLAGTKKDPSALARQGHEEGRESREGRANVVLGKRFGIGEKSVELGVKVLKQGAPELIDKVEQGEITVKEAARIAAIKNKKSQAQIVTIDSKKGRDAEVQKRTRISTGKAKPTVADPPGTPFVRRFLSRMEAMTNDLAADFKTKTPEEIADRFCSEFDGADAILGAQLGRALIVMKAASIVVDTVAVKNIAA